VSSLGLIAFPRTQSRPLFAIRRFQ
jgi:hypothetical protein